MVDSCKGKNITQIEYKNVDLTQYQHFGVKNQDLKVDVKDWRHKIGIGVQVLGTGVQDLGIEAQD